MIDGTVVALSGGIGGAKLSLGLLSILPPQTLSIIVNTGDDFEHLGMHVSPDIDTTLYTLAGLVNPETGWGQRDETWRFMEDLAHSGGETWFRIGDRDRQVHIERTLRLQRGEKLSDITRDYAKRFSIAARILPMSDDKLRTRVLTNEGELGFQEYFVHRQCRPSVSGLLFEGAAKARPASSAVAALNATNLAAIIICPSNPWLSIDPLRALPGMRELVRASGAPVVAVSPLIAGKAVKGPTAKIMNELGLPVTPVTVARHYAGWIDGFVLDVRDEDYARQIDIPTLSVNTMMRNLADRKRLASETLQFAISLATECATS